MMPWCCKATFQVVFFRRLRARPGDYIWCRACNRRWLYQDGAWWKGTVVPRETVKR